MHCRDITDLAFETISGELTDAEWKCGAVETVSGTHSHFGATVLLRDASRCIALVEEPSGLDKTLAELAFRTECLLGTDRLSRSRH